MYNVLIALDGVHPAYDKEYLSLHASMYASSFRAALWPPCKGDLVAMSMSMGQLMFTIISILGG